MGGYTFTMAHYDKEEIREWLKNQELWPTDAYDVESLNPCPVLEKREKMLKEILPGWLWEGEQGSTILSIGTGKGYFERKYWGKFDKIYIIDRSDKTRLSLQYFPIPNAEYLGESLFHVIWGYRPKVVLKYGWLGASIHYLFGEFHGWEFMKKIAMMVSDTLVIDAGVFDADTPQGRYLLEKWRSEGSHDKEPYERYRRSQFSYACFRESIEGLWDVVSEWSTPAIEGRRTLVLKRILPPALQKSQLGGLELIVSREKRVENWAVYRTSMGIYKETPNITQLLLYDMVSKVMGWEGMVQWTVYDGDRFSGFVVRDYGDEPPDAFTPSISETMFLSLLSWSLPLGLLPADVARENIRMHDGGPVWIDIRFANLRKLDARAALWITTSTYKQYGRIPSYIGRAIYRA